MIYGYAQRLRAIRQDHEQQGRMRDFYAQFQGRPRPPGGAMFEPDKIPIFDALPEVDDSVRAWDLASSLRGDWTVGLKLVRLRDW